MAAHNDQSPTSQPSRLLSCFLSAATNGPENNAIMLCEVIGGEIQSISLRVAADMAWPKPTEDAA